MPDTITALPALTDLQRSGADELLCAPAPAVAYHEMWSRLAAGAEAALTGDDPLKAAALNLLAKICSMMLVPDDRAAPFKPRESRSHTWLSRRIAGRQSIATSGTSKS